MSDVNCYSAIASRSYDNAPSDGDFWTTETWIRQGEYIDSGTQYGPYYGTFSFGSAPAALSGRTIESAKIYIKRMTSGGGGTDPFTMYATTLSSVPGSGATSPPGNTSGSGYLIASLALGGGPASNADSAYATWYDLPVALAQAVVSGHCLCIYSGGSNYARLYGVESSYKPRIAIICTPEEPNLSAPTLDGIAEITTANKTFNWSNSVDSNGAVVNTNIYYEMQLSVDGGSTWRNNPATSQPYTTAGGVSEYAISNLKAAGVLGTPALDATQYYYNTACKIRLRACAVFNGTTYYSNGGAYVVSSAFTINYRLGLSAPSMLTASNTSPYEGQTGATYGVKYTLARPATYNTKDHLGATMGLTYYVQYVGGTVINSVPATVSDIDTPKDTARYTIPSDYTATDDFATTIKAYAVDAEGQVSPYITKAAGYFTIKRFRAPEIMITGATRSDTALAVSIKVANTGYGASGQIFQNLYNMGGNGSITYSLNGIDYLSATLGAWPETGLTNSFSVSGWSESKTDSDISVANNTVVTTKDIEDGTTVSFSSAAPIGLSVGTTYYAKRVDATHIKFCTSLVNVSNNITVDITGVNSGTTRILNLSLSPNRRYMLNIKAKNAPPDNTGLSSLTSAAASATVYEYTPAFAVMKDSNPGTGAANVVAAQSLIVTDDFSTAVDAGYVVAKNGMKVGANKVWHEGNDGSSSGLDADTLDGNHATAFATSGHNHDSAYAPTSNIAESAIAATSETGNGTKLVTATGTLTSGNIAAWDANGNAVDSLLAPSEAVMLVNRKNNTTNLEISNQLIQMGWGYIQGPSSATYCTESVTFPVPFNDVPIIAINYLGYKAGTPSGISDFSLNTQYAYGIQPTTSGFVASVYSRDSSASLSSSNYYGYSWLAIGTKSRS